MRKKHKEITDKAEVERLLAGAQVMHLCLHDQPAPYVVPINCGFADGCLYFHGAGEGKRIGLMEQNPHVSFSILCDYEVLPGETPCRFETRYASVVGTGMAEIVTDEAERIKGLDALMRAVGFEGETHYPQKHLARTTVCRVQIMTMHGKKNPAPKAAQD